MDTQRFLKINPDFDPNLLRVVTHPASGYGPGISTPWSVEYDGRTVTSGDLWYCVQWAAVVNRRGTEVL